MSYPVRFEMDYEKRRSRLTTFFRYFLIWPHLFFAFFYSIAFYVVWIVSWFALLFTGRWPDSLYGFSGGFLRYITRVTAYFYLGVDRYPPFNGGEDERYPVRVHIAPPQARQPIEGPVPDDLRDPRHGHPLRDVDRARIRGDRVLVCDRDHRPSAEVVP
jgi:hypothetical protein